MHLVQARVRALEMAGYPMFRPGVKVGKKLIIDLDTIQRSPIYWRGERVTVADVVTIMDDRGPVTMCPLELLQTEADG